MIEPQYRSYAFLDEFKYVCYSTSVEVLEATAHMKRLIYGPFTHICHHELVHG